MKTDTAFPTGINSAHTDTQTPQITTQSETRFYVPPNKQKQQKVLYDSER